jgi:uncharacterized membrane protein
MKILSGLFLITISLTLISQQKILFDCHGTEPFWNVSVTESSLIFQGPDIDSTVYYYKEIRHAIGIQPDYYYEFRLMKDGLTAGILILERVNDCKCSNGMSDELFEFDCILSLENATYTGCAARRK